MKLLFAALLFLFACNQNKPGDSGNEFSSADKIVYHKGNGSDLGNVNCDIGVTPEQIMLEMNVTGREGKLKKTYPFSQQKWDKLIASFDDLRIKGKALDDCKGGGSERLAFYKGDDKLISADNFGCGEDYRNFSGADIDLTYLIKEFDELKASLEKEYEREEEKREGRKEYKWTEAEIDEYVEECVKEAKSTGTKKKDLVNYCYCIMYELKEKYRTKKEADEAGRDEIAGIKEYCNRLDEGIIEEQ